MESQPNPNHELSPQQEFFDVVKKITLADSFTQPYHNAQLNLVTLQPEQLEELGAIALYVLKDRLNQQGELDNLCHQEIGMSSNQVDGLYHLSNGKMISPPIVEMYGDQHNLSPQDTTIIDGHHRIVSCIQNRTPLTVLTVAGVKDSLRLPFVSFSPADIAIVDDVPEQKRIISNPDLDEKDIRGLYRNLAKLGSNIRDQTHLLLPLIPWEVHQITRSSSEMEHWNEITESLKPYVPPLPSVISRPPLRIMLDSESGEILNRDSDFDRFQFVQKTSDLYSVAPFSADHYSRSDFYGRPTPAIGEGEALLVNKEHWKKSCTKLITLTTSAEATDYQPINISDIKIEEPHSLSGVTREKFNQKTEHLNTESKFIFIDGDFVAYNTDNENNFEPDPLGVVSHNDQIVLGLSSNTLFGINGYGVEWSYNHSWGDDKGLSTSSQDGPILLLEPDFLKLVKIEFGKTDQPLPNIKNQIIDKIEQTQWYNPSFDWNERKDSLDLQQSVALEREINQKTVWSGEVGVEQLLDLAKSGLVPDSKTITGVFINLLHSGKLELNSDYSDHVLVLEKKATPFGTILVPPSLPMSEAKTANSMKLPANKNRMDMSFTLPQTNIGKLSQRASTGELVSIDIKDFIKTISTSTSRLPFDIESLSHIFSSLIQLGVIKSN